jgi:hypothetical protein
MQTPFTRLGGVAWKHSWTAGATRGRFRGRAITEEEHRKILAHEPNRERRNFYEFCWQSGGRQNDIASLNAEGVNWDSGLVMHGPSKTGAGMFTQCDQEVKALFATLPRTGPLVPILKNCSASVRADYFKRACFAKRCILRLHSLRLVSSAGSARASRTRASSGASCVRSRSSVTGCSIPPCGKDGLALVRFDFMFNSPFRS